jgi:hypothetical protein
MDEFTEKTQHMHLNGVAEQITVPILITHGVGDRQIPVTYARETYEHVFNSPKRELRLFDDPEGGTEHIPIDNMPYVGGIIADWIAETVTEIRAADGGAR